MWHVPRRDGGVQIFEVCVATPRFVALGSLADTVVVPARGGWLRSPHCVGACDPHADSAERARAADPRRFRTFKPEWNLLARAMELACT
jgi:hypothetical protein